MDDLPKDKAAPFQIIECLRYQVAMVAIEYLFRKPLIFSFMLKMQFDHPQN